jgi:endonuclease/exonuclease/phosphatase family metal-dependent hydrolase
MIKQFFLYTLVVISFAGIAAAFSGGDTLRVATYNCLDFPGDDAAIRDPFFRTVFAAIDPDILVTQEMQSQAGLDSLQFSCLNYYAPAEYSAVAYHAGYDTNNGFFYKPSKVQFISANYIQTDLRDIGEFVVKILSSGEILHVFSTHFKADDELSAAAERASEANTLRSYLNGFPPGTKFMFVGDLNLYTSAEAAYTTLLESEGTNTGRLKDPINMPGAWHDNPGFARIHTQSPRTRSFGGGVTGGLNDRFDFILTADSALDPNIVPGHYWAYGNDGYHFDDSINQLPNHAVPDSVANGLEYASDHLPVVCDFVFPPNPDSVFTVQPVPSWNMVSVPIIMTDTKASDIYPNAQGNIYVYSNGAYYTVLQLSAGAGYWAKFGAGDTVRYRGNYLLSTSVTAYQGWNLIGSIADTIAASGVTTSPAGIMTSHVYGYNHGYFQTDSLYPGQAYWINVSQQGTLYLQSPRQASRSAH